MTADAMSLFRVGIIAVSHDHIPRLGNHLATDEQIVRSLASSLMRQKILRIDGKNQLRITHPTGLRKGHAVAQQASRFGDVFSFPSLKNGENVGTITRELR
jgi:hypothetical protein